MKLAKISINYLFVIEVRRLEEINNLEKGRKGEKSAHALWKKKIKFKYSSECGWKIVEQCEGKCAEDN